MRRLKNKLASGFALLEVLLATMLLCGLVFLFLQTTHNSQKQVGDQVAGKNLALLMNMLITQVVQHNGQCPNAAADITQSNTTIANCLNNGSTIILTQGFINTLTAEGFDPTKATVNLRGTS